MIRLNKYFKPSIISLQPYTSARDEYDGIEGLFLDANENPFDLKYNRYPDPYQRSLKNEIGKWRNIDPDYIFLGNGSDEIIDILIRSTCNSSTDRILCLDPSYGMYSVSSNINNIPLDLVSLNSDLSINKERFFTALKDSHKLVFICTPNNPDGGLVNDDFIKKVLTMSNGLVVIDEAYIDFSNSNSWIDRLQDYENLVVLQTFSKSLGGAGIRIGMAFMNRDLVSVLNKVKPPYNISSPNMAAAHERLQNIELVEKYIEEIKAQRDKLRMALQEFEIVEYIYPSEANFLLVKFNDVQLIFKHLIEMKIIVRDRSRLKHCEGCLRISVGSENDNDRLLKGLKKVQQLIKTER